MLEPRERTKTFLLVVPLQPRKKEGKAGLLSSTPTEREKLREFSGSSPYQLKSRERELERKERVRKLYFLGVIQP